MKMFDPRKFEPVSSKSYDAVASRKRSIEENSTPPPSPMDRLGKSFLYRSMTKRSVDECVILDPTSNYPYSGALSVHHNDIIEDGFPPDQRAGPIPAHMYLTVTVKNGLNSPIDDVHRHVEVSFLNQSHMQVFHPESGCAQPFQFFVHEATLILEELESKLRSVVRISYSKSTADNPDVGWKSLGSADFSLKDLLRQPMQGSDFPATLVDDYGTVVVGSDGSPFQVIVNLCLLPLEEEELQVVPNPPPLRPPAAVRPPMLTRPLLPRSPMRWR
jgi:hypothetical protein